MLSLGHEDWSFPIPLMRKAARWRFDALVGKEEILNRRIGQNELSAIQVSLAYVDAQREYALQDLDHDGVLEYAQKFFSEQGKRDGLYWETEPGAEPSPLGPRTAEANAEGFTFFKTIAHGIAGLESELDRTRIAFSANHIYNGAHKGFYYYLFRRRDGLRAVLLLSGAWRTPRSGLC